MLCIIQAAEGAELTTLSWARTNDFASAPRLGAWPAHPLGSVEFRADRPQSGRDPGRLTESDERMNARQQALSVHRLVENVDAGSLCQSDSPGLGVPGDEERWCSAVGGTQGFDGVQPARALAEPEVDEQYIGLETASERS